jgi:hypothetical protein
VGVVGALARMVFGVYPARLLVVAGEGGDALTSLV